MNVARLSSLGPRMGRLTLAAAAGALCALALVAPAAAQEATATASPIGGSVSGYGVSDWMNLILRLALVLVVIWFAIVAMRWWVRRMNGAVGNSGSHLQIVESRSLGPNRSLQLVRLGNRAVLLGVTNERISPVLEIDDPAEVERLARPSVTEDSPTSFRDAVSRLGALTRWRPVIERKRSAQPTAGAPPTAAARGATARAPMPAASAAPTAPQRSRWMTLARRVVGLEDRPMRPMQGARPGAAPMRARQPAAGRAPLSMAAAGTAAAELPASRAVRARSGYRQNQIAEAQRAIASVREQMPR